MAAKKPVPSINKPAGKYAPPNPPKANPKKGKRKVNPPINIIGKIHIPKDIFQLLKLGANYAIEWAQRPQAPAKEELNLSQFNKFNLDSAKKQELLPKYHLTADCLIELEKFFKCLANTCKTQPEEFWLLLIQQDTKPCKINLSLFDIIKKGKFNSPTKRLEDFLKSNKS